MMGFAVIAAKAGIQFQLDSPLKTLLIGLGNPYCGDDAIGIIVAQQLKNQHPGSDLDIITGALTGMNLTEAIAGEGEGEGEGEGAGYDRVIILDALIITDENEKTEPGGLYEIKIEDFKGLSGANQSYLHSMTLAQALEIGVKLGLHMPKTLKLIGIGIRRKCDYGDPFDPVLQSKIPVIIDQLINNFFI